MFLSDLDSSVGALVLSCSFVIERDPQTLDGDGGLRGTGRLHVHAEAFLLLHAVFLSSPRTSEMRTSPEMWTSTVAAT